MADIDVTIGADTSEYDAALKKAQKSNQDFENSTKKMGLSAAESFALITTGVNAAIQIVGKVADALKAPIEAFRESELAANKLSNALQNQGLNVADLSKKYSDIAKRLQEKTGVDDDAIKSSLALLQSFVGQNEISEDLATTLVNVAEKTGSLESAAQTLGLAINGNTRGLRQFGVSIDETGTRSQITAELVTKLGARVGGLAVTANQGLGGLRGLKSAFSDLLETIGEQFAPVLGEIITALRNLTTTATQGSGLKILAQGLALLGKPIVFIINRFNDVLAVLNSFNSKIESVAAKAKSVGSIISKFFGGGPVGEVAGPPEPPAGKSVEERKREDDNKAAAKAEEDRKARVDARKEQNQEEFDQLIAQNEEFQALKETQQEDFLEANREQLLKAFQTTSESQEAFAQESLNKQIAANNKYLLEQQKFGTAYAAINKVIYSDQVQGAGKAFGELTALQKSNNSTLKAIGKAAAVADITIKTAQSAMNIYAGFSTIPIIGPILGIAGAAAAVAFGAEQVGNVLAAQQGGIVPGINKGFDSVPALLQPGELVVPRNSFSEVVGAVADRRAELNGTGTSSTSSVNGGGGGGQVTARLEFSGDGAEKFLTARQVEARSLGTLAEAS